MGLLLKINLKFDLVELNIVDVKNKYTYDIHLMDKICR